MRAFHPRPASLAALLGLALGLPSGCSRETPHGRVPQGQEQRGDEHEGAGHSHARAAFHGGTVTMTKEFHFEAVFHHDAVLVYGYDMQQNPVDLRGVQGRLHARFRDTEREPVDATLRYVAAAGEADEHEAGRHEHAEADHAEDSGHLAAAADFAKVEEGGAKVTFSLEGLPGTTEHSVTFRETFRLARLTEPRSEHEEHGGSGETRRFVYACPMHPKVTARESTTKCWRCGMTLTKTYDSGGSAPGHDAHDHDK